VDLGFIQSEKARIPVLNLFGVLRMSVARPDA
jgi:hypothetical protein